MIGMAQYYYSVYPLLIHFHAFHTVSFTSVHLLAALSVQLTSPREILVASYCSVLPFLINPVHIIHLLIIFCACHSPGLSSPSNLWVNKTLLIYCVQEFPTVFLSPPATQLLPAVLNFLVRNTEQFDPRLNSK